MDDDTTSSCSISDSVDALENNELLCFIQQKGDLIPVDDIVKICADFYGAEDVEKARSILLKYVNQKRLPKQRGTEKEIMLKTVTLLVKVCLDPSVHLPTFCAVNLARLPPVDIDHVDISAILTELSALRREVRAVTQLRSEVEQLRRSLDHARVQQDSEFPPLPSIASTSTEVTAGNGNTFAQLAQDLSTTPGPLFKVQPNKPARKIVVGASTANQHVKSVMTSRSVDVFVSRLHPQTSPNELVDCVKTMQGDINVLDISCHKLQSKYETLYSSYHVNILVDAAHMKPAIDTFMAPDSWPVGVFVKRFFKAKPKDGSQQ